MAPLVKSLGAALVMGGGLWYATSLALSGREGKLVLMAKCMGLGFLAVAVYAALLLAARQEDFMELLGRYKKPEKDYGK